MYTTAAYIVECMTNKTLQEFVTEKILKPLGMDASTYYFDERMVGHGLADGFVVVESGHPEGEGRDQAIYKPIPYLDSHGNTSPNAGPGGIISNVKDVASLLLVIYTHNQTLSFGSEDTMVADATPHGTASRHQRTDYPRSGNSESSRRSVRANSLSKRSFSEPFAIWFWSGKLFIPGALCTYIYAFRNPKK